jgi:hypothetical protein
MRATALGPFRKHALLALAFIALPSLAAGDAILRSNAMAATTIVEFFIEEGRILVELEIGAADLAAFRNLMPDEIHERMGHPPQPLAERLQAFFARDLPILGPDALPLSGSVLQIGPGERVLRDNITGEPLPAKQGAQPETVVRASLVYPFEGQPETLTFSGPVSSSLGFVVYHQGIAVNDFRYLPRGVVLDLDWADPWYTRFRTRGLVRQYAESMSGFIYVEPYEVRKEVIVRPLDLQAWVDLGLEGRETIPAEIQAELKRRVAEFLRDHQPVEIDGERIAPELARIHFLERTLRTSRVIDPPEDLDIHSAVLGVIFVYPTEGLPERVTMEWDLWSDRLQRVPASSVDQAGPLPAFLEPDWRVLEWQNFLKNPELPTLTDVVPPPSSIARAALWLRWIALAAALGAMLWMRGRPGPRAPLALALLAFALGLFWIARDARLDEARSREVVTALLHNIYRAFDHRDEERVYDVLERSAAGDLLEQIYLDTRRGLVLASQGGARVKVKEIELEAISAKRADAGAFRADATWTVRGSVGHWGHVHQRRNRVRAGLTVAPVDGDWKLIDLELIEEERL